jgi:hypothetical protein
MKKSSRLTLFALLFLSMTACKKDDNDSILDKEITLNFHMQTMTASKATFETSPEFSYLIGFDKRDYKNVDSVVFIAGLATNYVNDTCYARLVNLTDNIEIANSTLHASTNGGYKLVQTNNIFNSLPNKRINLGIQIRTTNEESYHFAFITEPYLKLRRH